MQHNSVLKKDVNELAPVYLAYGEDAYLIEEFIDKFIEQFSPAEFRDFNLNILEEDEELVSRLINAVKTLPFMVDKRIVIVNTYEFFTKKVKDIDIVYNLLADFPESTVLFFISHNKPNKRLKIFKEIKKIGQVLKFNPLKYKKLDKWIENKVGKLGYKIENQAINLLEEAFNSDLQRLDSELNKLITFVGKKTEITKVDVESIISRDWLVKDNIIFDFVDAIGKKNTSLALELLADILQEGTEPKQILGMIARQIRLILQTKLLSRDGLTPKQIAKKLNQHPYPIKKCLKQSNNFSVESLEMALERLFKADYRLVTGADQELELEFLVIDLKEAI